MTYPLDQLALVAPIIFIILVVAFPLIGLLAGWKRGLYWGGGNLVIYIIGMVIWRFAGTAIAGALTPLIKPLLESLGGSGDITKLAASVLAPIFFILWFAINELALLINYFAWYKRVVGLQKPKKQDKDGKQKAVKVQVNTKQGGKAKAINMLGGALCLGALTVPTTIAFTDSLYYLTTSRATRATKGLSKDLYNGLSSLQSKMWWFSFYTVTDTAVDYDGLFSGLSLMTKKIPHVDPTTGQLVEQEITITEAITETFTKGFSQIFFETQQEESEETEEKIAQDLNNLAESWNFIIENYEDDVTPLFESTNVTTFVSSILETMFGEKQTVDDAMVTNFYGEGCLFDQMASAYQEGKYGDQDITKLMPINVSEDSYNAIEGAIMNTYIFECDDTNKGIFEQKIQDVIAMVFVPPWLQQ